MPAESTETSRILERLRACLAVRPPGEIVGDEQTTVVNYLIVCWDNLDGSDAGGMMADKLFGRTERLHWALPVLTFTIERHGARMRGSTRAELQKWEVDVERGAAGIVGSSWRQLEPMDARLDIKGLAANVAAWIVEGRQDDPRLKWANPTRVRIQMGATIRGTNAQTTASRSKRFTAALEQILKPKGWLRIRVGSHRIFERTTPE
jgi:hypothetical protein